jgi:hypothetical protein
VTRIVELGKQLQSRIKDFFDAPIDAASTPLEIVRAVLEELELKVQPVGRGRRVFPYNRITVRVGPTAADRPALLAALETVDARLRERLTELQCPEPAGLTVRVALVKKTPAEWQAGRLFAIDYAAEAVAPAAPAPATVQATMPVSRDEKPACRPVRIAIVKGAAGSDEFTFQQPVIAIGRTPEPTDDHGRVRRNDIAFLDVTDGITETVGRAHARIQFDPATAEYRIFNDGSSNPTFIVRSGTTIQVAPRDPRGVRLRSGDEIHLGRAAMQLTLDA